MQLVTVFVLAAVATGSQLSREHPVERVISLLQDLSAKVETEGKAEELTYAQFETWCSDSRRTLEQAVSKEKQSIDALQSKVEGKTKESATLTEQISGLSNELLQYEAAASSAADQRKKVGDLYTAADKDLADTVTAIQQAIDSLTQARTSTSALIQTRLQQLTKLPLLLEQLTASQREALLAHADPEVLAKGNYDASVKKYSFKSGDIIELLKQLKTKFEDDRLEGTKAETNAQNAHALSSSARSGAIQASTGAKAEKMVLLGTAQTEIVSSSSALTSSQADLEADSTSLSNTDRSCAMKKSEWADRSSLRTNELKAIAAGIDILTKVSGVRVAAPVNAAAPSPLSYDDATTTAPATALIESESEPSPAAFIFLKAVDPKARAVNLLRSEARKIHSSTFERFADQVEASLGGPFDEVNNMIQKMVFHLMDEQKDEDGHKNWCDLELEKSNSSKVNKMERIASFETKIADASASSAVLAAEIQADNEMVSKIDVFLEESTAVRQAGKLENQAAIKESREAQAAIAQATAVLESFYKGSGMVAKESWELLQRGVNLPAEPSTWSADYTGVADPKNQPGGVITVLKAISADFSKMEADTVAQEVTDQKAYDEAAKSSAIEKARRVSEAELKGQERKRLLTQVEETQRALKSVNTELGAVEQYLKDLSPACIEGDSTYEDRKAARAAEVSALKEAQVMLEGAFKEDAAVETTTTAADTAAGAASFLSPVKRGSVQK